MKTEGDRQAATIEPSDERLVPLGWDERFAAALKAIREGGAGGPGAGLEPGRVIAVHRGTSVVRTVNGDLPAGLAAQLRLAIRGPMDYPAVGDWVAVQPASGGGAGAPATASGRAAIHALLPRRGALVRTARDAARRGPAGHHDEQVLAANVDVAFVVDSFDSGPNLRRLERYLALAWSARAHPVVVLNKADVADADAIAGALATVATIAPGVAVVLASARTGGGIAAIRAEIRPGRTAVVVGPSGAGKSTIVNGLLGEARQATGEVRLDDSRGRHTTTVRELFELPGGGLIIDTPGIRSLELAMDEGALDRAFAEIAALALQCRFADCRHEGEPGCAVLRAVEEGRLTPERLANARRLTDEAGRRSAAGSNNTTGRKRRDKTIAPAVRQHSRIKDRGPTDR